MLLNAPKGPLFTRTGIIVGGRTFEHWTDYSIQADIFNPSDTFSMRCGPMPADVLREILPGRHVSIYFGNDKEDHIVMTGWTEGFHDDTSKESSTTNITGRDLASDLLENSVPAGLDVRDKTFYELAQAVCDPLGISVIATNEANRLAIANKKKHKKAMVVYGMAVDAYNSIVTAYQYRLSQANVAADEYGEQEFAQIMAANGVPRIIRPPYVPGIFKHLDEAEPSDGESCWDFLVKYAERMEVHMWMSASGMLVIQRPRYDQDPMYSFVVSESRPELTNCRMRYGLDIAGMPTRLTRTGKYVGRGEKRQRLEDVRESTKLIPTSDENTIIPEGSIRAASDFMREKWTDDTEASTLDEIQRKNHYDMVAHETGFLSLEIEVPGHDQGGNLYTYDTVAYVYNEKLGIDRNFYVSSCTYDMPPKSENTSGPITLLRLTPMYAWSPMG